MDAQNVREVTLAGSQIKRSCHACAFYNSAEEYYEILMPFIKEGVEVGDKVLHIMDACEHDSHMARLQECGIVDAASPTPSSMELVPWEETYLAPGHFSQDAMLELVEKVLVDAKTAGFQMSRLIGNMEWACKESVPGVKDLVKYETRLNLILPHYDNVVVCTYDLAKHSASVVMDILRTHPMVIVGGTMQENPFFVPPEEFLAELEARELDA